jgi:mRNA-decapping enzyme 1B
MNFLKQAATCVHTIGGTGAVLPNQSFRAIPSPSHGSHNSTAPHSSSLHSLLPSQTSSVTLRAFDAHRPNSSTTIQPASLLDSKPPLLAPMASTHSTIANAASSLPTVPPLHPPFADRQPKSAPLLHPFPLPTVPPVPPYGMPLLQPFPPNPLPLLTPSASYSQVVTREQVGAALLRLAQVFSLPWTLLVASQLRLVISTRIFWEFAVNWGLLFLQGFFF